jgi:sugar phosphate isomerase/epimerase
VAPRLSVSQITTLRSSFADDVRDYAAAGFEGIGVWELKLGEGADAEALEALETSGLEFRGCDPRRPVCPTPAAPRRA